MNIGKGIKGLSIVLVVIVIIGCVVAGINEADDATVTISFIGGVVCSISTFILGEIVDRLTTIDKHLDDIAYYLKSLFYQDEN